MRILEAVRKLMEIHARRGDVELECGDPNDPLKRVPIADIRESPPYDFHEQYDPSWRACVELEGFES
jgi:hypothetical protein